MASTRTEGLQSPVQFLKGVGPRRADELAGVGIETVEDLLLSLPKRYEDRARLQPIGALRADDSCTVSGEVLSCGVRNTRRPGFRIFEMVVEDDSGRIRATFLNQAYLKDVFAPHQRVVLFGNVERRRSGGLQLTNPEYEVVADPEEAPAGEEVIHLGDRKSVV